MSEVEGSTKSVVALLSMLHEGSEVHSATRLFEERPVLDHTLSRLARAGLLGETWITCWDDQAAAVAPVASEHGAVVLVKSPRQPVAQLDALTAARRWSDGWRGGLRRTTCFDAGWHGESVLEVLDESSAAAVVLIDPAAAVVDPAIIDALVEQSRNHPEVAYTFAPAAPGLGGMLLTRPAVESLVASNKHPGRLLSYDPATPVRDALADASCAAVATPVARTLRHFLFNSERQLRRGMGVPPMIRPKGVPPLPDQTCDAWKGAEQGQDAPATNHGRDAHATAEVLVLEAKADERLDSMPREVVLELTTRRATNAIDSPGRFLDIHRPDLTADLAAALFAELGKVDDLRLSLAGVGDPLLHPQFAEIINAAKSSGIRAISVETDLLPDTPEILDELPNLGIDVLTFRLPAMLPATYAAVMGVDRMADALRNLKRLLIARKSAGSVTPLLVPLFTKCRENLAEMEAWYDHWLNTLDGAVIRGPTTCGGQIPDAAVADMSPPRRVPCRRLSSRITVLSDGRVTTCEEDVSGAQSLGRIGETSLADLWRNAMTPIRANHHLQMFEETPVCADCKERHRP